MPHLHKPIFSKTNTAAEWGGSLIQGGMTLIILRELLCTNKGYIFFVVDVYNKLPIRVYTVYVCVDVFADVYTYDVELLATTRGRHTPTVLTSPY